MKNDRKAIRKFNENMVQAKRKFSYLSTRREKIKLCAKDEKFAKVKGIEGNEYYISNYGRLLSKVNANGTNAILDFHKITFFSIVRWIIA